MQYFWERLLLNVSDYASSFEGHFLNDKHIPELCLILLSKSLLWRMFVSGREGSVGTFLKWKIEQIPSFKSSYWEIMQIFRVSLFYLGGATMHLKQNVVIEKCVGLQNVTV